MVDPSNIDGVNIHVNGSLTALSALRVNFGVLFSILSEKSTGSSEDDSEKIAKYMNDIQSNVRDLEKNLTAFMPAGPNVLSTGVPAHLTNLDALFMDPSNEKNNLYQQVLETYDWVEKASVYSHLLQGVFSAHHSRRTSSSSKRKRPLNATVTPQAFETQLQSIRTLFPGMSIVLSRPFGTNAILQVTLDRVLKAVITFRGLLIENVIVKSHYESHFNDNGEVDYYTPSRYAVFEKITDHATAATLHFCTPGFAELSIRSFFTWLNSFNTLFSASCIKCNSRLRNNFPATWREFRNLQPFHENCRP